MEWISVKDRLPQIGQSVGWAYDNKKKEIRHDVYYLGFNNSWESMNSLGYYVNEQNITHWMPLPEPPKD